MNAVYYVMISILLAMQVVDVATTARVLKLGGREANPVMAWLIRRSPKRWGAIKIAVMAAVCLVLWADGPSVASWVALVFMLLAYGYTIVNNARTIRVLEARGRR